MIRLKNERQIEGIRKSCKLLASLFEELGDHIKPGISTWDIDKIAEEYIKKNKGSAAFKGYDGFPGSICASVNDTVIHGIPNKKEILKEGDIFGCDIGIILDDFFSDSAYTYKVGTVKEDVRLLLERTEEALMKGISAAKAGGRVKDIGKAISSYIEPFGYGIVHSFCGHGVGLYVHEEPQIPNNYPSRRMNTRLKPGRVLALEPIINMGTAEVEVLDDDWTVKPLDRSLSAHFEHTIVILKDKTEILTVL
jgi:methionyl aminopeptidase